MIGPETIEKVIQSAQSAGALSASAVWAIVCLYFVWDKFRRDQRDDGIIEVRLRSAEASIKNAEAIEQVSERIVQMMVVNSELSSIIRGLRDDSREMTRRIKCLDG